MNTIFYVSGAVAILSTLVAITRANAVHGVLNLVVSFLSVAVVLFSLGSPFAAILEVIIYAGAIMVTFVFVVMMLKVDEHTEEKERLNLRPRAWLIPGTLSLFLLVQVILLISRTAPPEYIAPGKTAVEIGLALYGPYVVGLELVSIVLMTGLVAACHLGRKGDDA